METLRAVGDAEVAVEVAVAGTAVVVEEGVLVEVEVAGAIAGDARAAEVVVTVEEKAEVAVAEVVVALAAAACRIVSPAEAVAAVRVPGEAAAVAAVKVSGGNDLLPLDPAPSEVPAPGCRENVAKVCKYCKVAVDYCNRNLKHKVCWISDVLETKEIEWIERSFQRFNNQLCLGLSAKETNGFDNTTRKQCYGINIFFCARTFLGPPHIPYQGFTTCSWSPPGRGRTDPRRRRSA